MHLVKFQANLSIGKSRSMEDMKGLSMINKLSACCTTGDDEQMLFIIRDLVKTDGNRVNSAIILLAALDLRPNMGPFLEPKEWRSEVKSCLWQLYGIGDLQASLSVLTEPVADRIKILLGKLFDQPLALINPVLEAVISWEDYLPIAGNSLEVIVAACQNYVAQPDDIEVRFNDLETLAAAVSELENSLKRDAQLYELKNVATQLHDLLDNPEVNLWQS
jgi:hypothetical protein